MKIGILTLPLHVNYGGILQAYALQSVLERMGHEVKVITTDHSAHVYPLYKVVYCFLRRVASRVLKGQNIEFYNINNESKYHAERHQNTDIFINQYIKRHFYRSLSDDVCKTDFDAFVVGSDQIWRRLYIQGSLKIFDAFLDFAKDWQVRRIAYAASFGIDQWDYDESETAHIKELLHLFEAVSVREQNGVDLCGRYLDTKASFVLDPTLLLEKEQYEQIIDNSPGINQPTHDILTHYVLDKNDELDRLIQKVGKDKGLEPLSLDLYHHKEKKIPSLPSVEQWLEAFRNASFVITDSFHACVFSIIFQKPFIVIGNKNRGYARFRSLLHAFGLERNLITSVTEYNPNQDYSIPPYSYIKLKELQQFSLRFLHTNFS